MRKALDYVYFRVFFWLSKHSGEAGAPEWSALLMLSVMLGFNITAVIFVIEHIYDAKIATKLLSTPAFGGAFAAVLLLVNYFIWYRESNRSKIIERYISEPAEVRSRRTRYVITYAAISVFLPILLIVTLN